jgi:signal peptidase II
MKFFCRRNVLIINILLVFTVLDQVTKILVRSTYATIGPKTFLANTINYVYVENPGAFLSLGANLPDWLRFFIFSILVSIGLGFVLRHLFKSSDMSKISTIALSLIMAGGVGNLIDRIFRGTVTDFLVMGIGELRTGVFNVADFIIVVGSILLVWEQFVLSKKTKSQNEKK